MDSPHLFQIVSLGTNQGRPIEPARPAFVRAFAAYDAWMAIGSRWNVAPTSVCLERQPPHVRPQDVPGDLYELRHHGRAGDLRLVRAMPEPAALPAPRRRGG